MTKKLINIEKTGDHFKCELTPEGQNCQFLQFLVNTSNFTWNMDPEKITTDLEANNHMHLISKLCAIGYLFQPIKMRDIHSRAVIAIDGKETIRGGTGKSLFADVLRSVTSSVCLRPVNNKNIDNMFIWDQITEGTNLVVLDGISSDFNFTYLFSNITGDWNVNKRGQKHYSIPHSKSPKLLLIKSSPFPESSRSYMDRQWYLEFSDFYNDKHKPFDDFGDLFIHEWDKQQFSLFNQLLIECMQIFNEFGVVLCYTEVYQYRSLRCELGEPFIEWADNYYNASTLNKRIPRREIHVSYWDSNYPRITPTEFKIKLKKYCRLKGYLFNPNKLIIPSIYGFLNVNSIDRSGSIEYITIGTSDAWIK